MKSTIAENKQLFNVKNIAYNTDVNVMLDGQFGVFPEGSDISVPVGTTFATLPDTFRIISKMGGKVYYSFDSIEKAKMFNKLSKATQTEQTEIWKGLVEYCSCMDNMKLHINISEQSLVQRDGLTGAHSDFVVEVPTAELLCLCSCDGTKPVYENHIMTQLLFNKIIDNNSPFYTADVEDENAVLITVGADATAKKAALETFIAANKIVNTDAVLGNESVKLVLVLKTKQSLPNTYRDLEVNYVYPRGVSIKPSLRINDSKSIVFTKTQALRYEIGDGSDMRAEEFENMNYYTNLNHYSQLSDGIASANLVYQFENGKKYNTISFENKTEKVNTNDGDTRLFGTILGIESPVLFAELVTMFI